ncbi:hypothetical protein NM208_g13997 [Fusarium decemcellulare]|uniref:Uncharacterized protein n=1 Tax=Fusarium decemcellulare TaxID=57161 RepID=A0ACC1RL70_9HYPO|nr:hypothetical protein NM208_g13997 [Fusarium decemcellulare]
MTVDVIPGESFFVNNLVQRVQYATPVEVEQYYLSGEGADQGLSDGPGPQQLKNLLALLNIEPALYDVLILRAKPSASSAWTIVPQQPASSLGSRRTPKP